MLTTQKAVVSFQHDLILFFDQDVKLHVQHDYKEILTYG